MSEKCFAKDLHRVAFYMRKYLYAVHVYEERKGENKVVREREKERYTFPLFSSFEAYGNRGDSLASILANFCCGLWPNLSLIQSIWN